MSFWFRILSEFVALNLFLYFDEKLLDEKTY